MRVVFLYSLLSLSFISAFAQQVDTLFEMSLEELMNVKVKTGNIVGLKKHQNPSAITIITSDQIEKSPVRNILDLIELYVPGAMYINHTSGTKLVMRGIQGNYKMLLLVNGKNLNSKASLGANLELRNWDLNDIERIEVIRNPGSSTYGPGASGGVINIITKTKSSDGEKIKVGSIFNWPYNSKGGFVQYFEQLNNVSLATHFSLVSTTGVTEPYYYRGGNGVINDSRGQTYMADFLGKPQVKAHIQLTNQNNWTVWSRYTRSGQTSDIKRKDEFISGYQDSYFTDDENFVLVGEKVLFKEGRSELTAKASFDSENMKSYAPLQLDLSPRDKLNRYIAISENELFGNVTYEYSIDEKFQIAALAEYSYDYLAKPWFENDNDFIWASQALILPNVNSPYISQGVFNESNVDVYSAKIGVSTFSGAMESSVHLAPDICLIYSFRLDKNQWMKPLYSNRLAISKKLNDFSFKLLGQRTLRMNTLTNLYVLHQLNKTSRAENLDAIEFITDVQKGKWTISHNVFYNRIEQVSFNGSKTDFIGTQQTIGTELDIRFKYKKYDIGFMYSYVKQIDWDMNPSIRTGNFRQPVSYSDYLYHTGFLTLTNTGNDMMNWANQSMKLFGRYTFNNGVYVNGNAIMFFDYQGYKDEIKAYEKAYASVDVGDFTQDNLQAFTSDYEVFLGEINQLKAENTFEVNYSISMMLGYTFKVKTTTLDLSVGVQNISNSYKRYSYSPGSNATYPNRVRFVKEPLNFMTSLKVSF